MDRRLVDHEHVVHECAIPRLVAIAVAEVEGSATVDVMVA
jgi:hypothetical protein